MGYLLQLMLVVCCYTKASDGLLRINAEPTKVEIGVTKKLDIHCSYPVSSDSINLRPVSLIVSRANNEFNSHFVNASFRELLSLTPPSFIKDIAGIGSSERAAMSGSISEQDTSYVNISWSDPKASVLGLYRCTMFSIDIVGHPSELSEFVLVSVETPDMDVFAERFQDLTHSVVKLQKYYTYIEDKLNTASHQLIH